MKKIAIFSASIALSFAIAASDLQGGQSNTGCGLGTLIFESHDGLISQVSASFTNGILSNQAFGITTGTSRCRQFSRIASNEQINRFISENMDSLATDISKGKGEYLNTLAVLMEVKEIERARLYKKLQTNYSNIYTSESVTSAEVASNIEKVIKS